MNKALIKEKALEITKAIAFILVFILLIEFSSVKIFTEEAATKYNNGKKDAYSFINEEQKSIQIVGVGNSDLYAGFSPLELWKNYRITSVVSASARQTLQESYNMLEMIFENQKPELVIIETDMFYDHNPEKDNVVESNNTSMEFFDKMHPDYFTREVENTFSVFKFHNYWKGGQSSKKNVPYNTHGYRYNNKVYKIKKTEYMIKTSKMEKLSAFNKDQMDMLLDLCKSKNAKVLLLEMPSISSWNYERHNAVDDYAKSRNVPFLDLNLLYDDIGLDMRNCFRDKGNHINHNGALAVTNYLGRYFMKQYKLIPQTKESIIKSWNKSLEKFEKYIEWTKKNEKQAKS